MAGPPKKARENRPPGGAGARRVLSSARVPALGSGGPPLEGGRGREWAEMVVVGKIDSQLAAARHHQRQGVSEATAILGRLAALRGQCAGAETESLRGFEGTASAAWFSLLGAVLREPFLFRQ